MTLKLLQAHILEILKAVGSICNNTGIYTMYIYYINIYICCIYKWFSLLNKGNYLREQLIHYHIAQNAKPAHYCTSTMMWSSFCTQESKYLFLRHKIQSLQNLLQKIWPLNYYSCYFDKILCRFGRIVDPKLL